MTGRPRSRQEEVVVEELGDDVVAYDARVHQAHALEGIVAGVWRACDGERDISAIAAACDLGEAVVAES
jgi:hypothetical protein